MGGGDKQLVTDASHAYQLPFVERKDTRAPMLSCFIDVFLICLFGSKGNLTHQRKSLEMTEEARGNNQFQSVPLSLVS